MSYSVVLQIQLIASYMMAGLIWLVQVVHYPSFYFVNKTDFSKFHSFHSQKITFIVAPLMGAELTTAGILAFQNSLFWKFNFLIVLLTWIATAVISVPLHNRLSKGYDAVLVKKLIQTNWIRTGLWTLKGVGLSIGSFYLISGF